MNDSPSSTNYGGQGAKQHWGALLVVQVKIKIINIHLSLPMKECLNNLFLRVLPFIFTYIFDDNAYLCLNISIAFKSPKSFSQNKFKKN